MLLPPFTLLIVKKNRRPVTIRVTGWFVFILIVLCGTMLMGTTMIISRFTAAPSGESFSSSSTEPTASVTYMLTAESADTASETYGSVSADPDVSEFEVTRTESGDVVFSFSIANTHVGDELYLWIMVNPNATDPTESAIYPRSPRFRGLPVDYRNGITHIPQSGRRLRLTFSGPETGITLDQFRILAYEPSGDLILDKTLTVHETIRM